MTDQRRVQAGMVEIAVHDDHSALAVSGRQREILTGYGELAAFYAAKTVSDRVGQPGKLQSVVRNIGLHGVAVCSQRCKVHRPEAFAQYSGRVTRKPSHRRSMPPTRWFSNALDVALGHFFQIIDFADV